MSERDAFGVSEFCQRHGISKGFLYAEWRRGRGPRFMQVGDRKIITREAGADWRRDQEAATRRDESPPAGGSLDRPATQFDAAAIIRSGRRPAPADPMRLTSSLSAQRPRPGQPAVHRKAPLQAEIAWLLADGGSGKDYSASARHIAHLATDQLDAEDDADEEGLAAVRSTGPLP